MIYMGTKIANSSILLLWMITMCITLADADNTTGEKLYDASKMGDLDGVRKLAGDNCTGVNWRSDNDSTPLHVASQRNHKHIVMFLISCHAFVDAQESTGRTSLIHAVENDYEDMVNILLAVAPNLELKMEWGDTALMFAAAYSNVNVAKALLKHGANIKAIANNGMSILHVATKHNRKENVELALQFGVDKEIKSNSGQTAADIAKSYGNVDILNLIENFHETTIKAKQMTAFDAYMYETNNKDYPSYYTKISSSSNDIRTQALLLVILVIVFVHLLISIKNKPFKQPLPIAHNVTYLDKGNRQSHYIYDELETLNTKPSMQPPFNKH